MRLRTARRGVFLLLVFGVLLPAETFAQGKRNTQRRPQNNRQPGKRPAPKKPANPAPVMRKLPSVTPVSPSTYGSVKTSAAEIDRLVSANYRKHSVTPNPESTDEQFVRRIYLDITGTIPTLIESKLFLNSRDPDKRRKLIDKLLNSYGYVQHSYNYWGDVLRLQDRPQPNIYAYSYNAWVKDSIRKNVPYDKWVDEMLTAEGKLWESPAAGYTLRDAGMPLDHMANTVRVFLGTQIGCAQCHDHPFDRWKQKEFYELASFTYGTLTRSNAKSMMYGNKPAARALTTELNKLEDRRMRGSALRVMRTNNYDVYENPRRRLRFPHDYAYDDAKPNTPVSPDVLWGRMPSLKPGQSPRAAFSEWVTSRDNPRFTKTIANRMWKRVMGMGQFEPVDNLNDETTAENPELLKYLEGTLLRVDFDLKEFQRILYNTKTYQRQASTGELKASEEYHFPGPLLRRMSAEQVWDSFLTLAVTDPNEYQAPSVADLTKIMNVDLAKANTDLLVKRGQELTNFTGKEKREYDKKYKYKGLLLARSAELPLPAPLGHPLRQFGQGDREIIEGSSYEGSVAQILTMFNGPVTHMMLEGGSKMYNNVIKAKSVADRIDVIFLTVLSRKPTSSERQIASQEIRENGNAGYGNVIWALVNTREFLFIQ